MFIITIPVQNHAVKLDHASAGKGAGQHRVQPDRYRSARQYLLEQVSGERCQPLKGYLQQSVALRSRPSFGSAPMRIGPLRTGRSWATAQRAGVTMARRTLTEPQPAGQGANLIREFRLRGLARSRAQLPLTRPTTSPGFARAFFLPAPLPLQGWVRVGARAACCSEKAVARQGPRTHPRPIPEEAGGRVEKASRPPRRPGSVAAATARRPSSRESARSFPRAALRCAFGYAACGRASSNCSLASRAYSPPAA